MNTTLEMENVQNVINWLDTLHETMEGGVVTNRKSGEAQAAATVLRALVSVQNPPVAVNLNELSLKTIREAYTVAFGPLPDAMYSNEVDAEIVRILREAGHAGKHADDVAIDEFAEQMKVRMRNKRVQGRQGWDDPEQCPINTLMELWEECAIGKPVDSGIYSMMLYHRFKRS